MVFLQHSHHLSRDVNVAVGEIVALCLQDTVWDALDQGDGQIRGSRLVSDDASAVFVEGCPLPARELSLFAADDTGFFGQGFGLDFQFGKIEVLVHDSLQEFRKERLTLGNWDYGGFRIYTIGLLEVDVSGNPYEGA